VLVEESHQIDLVADAFVFISFVFIIQPCDINTNALINCCCRHVSHFAIVSFFLLFLAEKKERERERERVREGGGQSFKDQGGREGGEGAGQGPGCIYDNKISSNKNSNSKEFLFFFFSVSKC